MHAFGLSESVGTTLRAELATPKSESTDQDGREHFSSSLSFKLMPSSVEPIEEWDNCATVVSNGRLGGAAL